MRMLYLTEWKHWSGARLSSTEGPGTAGLGEFPGPDRSRTRCDGVTCRYCCKCILLKQCELHFSCQKFLYWSCNLITTGTKRTQKIDVYKLLLVNFLWEKVFRGPDRSKLHYCFLYKKFICYMFLWEICLLIKWNVLFYF